MEDRKPVIVLTTVGTTPDATKLAREIVESRLAACVNVIDQVRSFFRWEGSVDEETENLLVIKTLPERVAALREHIIRVHPYDTPEFIVVEVEEVWDKYGAWLADSCREPSG